MGPSDKPVVDWQVAVATVDGNRKLLGELVDLFLDECPKLVAGIQSSIADRSAKDLRRNAHTLKGCLRYFGPSAAGETACQLESLGREQDFTNTNELFEQLCPEVERVLDELRAYAARRGVDDVS